MQDSSFNNLTRLAYKELICKYHSSAIKIFISATLDELKPSIYNSLNHIWAKMPNVYDYTTGIDYSYLDIKYFRKIKDIITTIKNDKTEDKWLLFVSSLKDAEYIANSLGEELSSIIKSGTKSDELNTIISGSKFNKKVLITTKVLDNGINIDDSKVKHIVIMAWDKITFIQMLGRKRIDIDNAETVNLYIACRYKKSFDSKIYHYNKKTREVELYLKDKNKFNRKYDNDLKKIGKLNDLFYKDSDSAEWKLNELGNVRLHRDLKSAEYIRLKFEAIGEYAFIKEQLKWLELEDTFSEANLIKNVKLIEDKDKLRKYMDSMCGKKLFAEEQQKFKEKMAEFGLKSRTLGINTINGYIKDNKLPFIVEQGQRKSYRDENGNVKKEKSHWIIGKIVY